MSSGVVKKKNSSSLGDMLEPLSPKYTTFFVR